MAIIGSILGDIAGSCHEFKRPESRDWKHMELFTDKNFFTDDTVLTCGTKLAIKNYGNIFSKYYKLLTVFATFCFQNSHPVIVNGIGKMSAIWYEKTNVYII